MAWLRKIDAEAHCGQKWSPSETSQKAALTAGRIA
jgi:hypothetical protein